MNDYEKHCISSLDEWIHEAVYHCENLEISEIRDKILDCLHEDEEYFNRMLSRIQQLKSIFTMQNNHNEMWTSCLEEDSVTGDFYVTLPDDLLCQLDWKDNQKIEVSLSDDKTILIQKVKNDD